MLTVYRVFYNVTLRIRDLQQLDQRLSFRINLLDFSLSIYSLSRYTRFDARERQKNGNDRACYNLKPKRK